MRRHRWLLGALLAMVGCVLLVVPAVAEPSASPSAGPVELDGVTLRWGVNDESGNRAFAPDTYNFLSAGTVPDPGKGGTTLPKSRWRQAAGDVAIEKWNGKAWQPATWEGLRTDERGKPLGSPTSGTFSRHRVVFGAGVGTVDVAAGTAHVTWDGDVTILYYSGMSFFALSDPVLDVADGRGTLTATLSGYASSVDDPTQWASVPAARVTVADLPEVTLDEEGLSATPAYLGVAVSGVGQVSGGPSFGSFPQSFVDYMDRLGTAAFWLSSGASTDAFKVPLPLSVGFGATAEEPVGPTPSATPTKEPLDNPVVPPPTTVTATVTARPAPAPADVPRAAPTLPAVPTAPAVDTALPLAAQLVAADRTPTAAVEPASEATRIWWLGGGLLLAAALTLLVPVGRPRRP